MKRLGALIAGAALVGGLGGAVIALALGGTSDSTSPGPGRSTAATPVSALTAGRSLAPESIYKNAAPSVVVISATENVKVPGSFFAPPSSQKVQIGGSGFVVDRQGDIVTNDHVVQDASNVRVGFSGGATYPAKVVGADASTTSPSSTCRRRPRSSSRFSSRTRARRRSGTPCTRSATRSVWTGR